MLRFSSIPSAFSRLLMAIGILLVGPITACVVEGDAPRDGVAGSTASALATNYTYYDFIAAAPVATWTNNDGTIPWGVNEQYGRGSDFRATGLMEDGVIHPYLFTQPKFQGTGAFMRGAFTVTIPAAAEHPTATATFGFTQGNAPFGGSLTFALKADVNGASVTLFSQAKSYTNALSTRTADLSAYAGQTLTLYPTVEGAWQYGGGWTDLRIVTDNLAPPSGTTCSIDGTSYGFGAANPQNGCEACVPTVNATGWTPTSASCRASYFDFIGSAPSAVWINNDGAVPFGTNEAYGRGAAYNASGAMEDGVSRPYLFTQPKWAGSADSFMRGAYTVTVPAASQHPSVTATFGYTQYNMGSLTFALKTQMNGNWVTLFSKQKTYTNSLATATADLSAYAGQTLTLYLSVEGGWQHHVGAWTDFRIVTDSAPPDGGFLDGGVTDAGDVSDGGAGDGGADDGGTALPCSAQTAAIQSSFASAVVPTDIGAVAMVKDPTCGVRYFTRGASRNVPQTSLHLIGSATKTYIASTILVLVDEGKLSLNDSVTKWIPGAPGGSALKVQHLLNHTSGIYNYTGDFSYMLGMLLGLHIRYTPRDLLNIAFAKAPSFAPGAAGKWEYSNTNYVALAMIIESVTGKPVAQVLREKILTPIGASATFYKGYEPVTGSVAFGQTFLRSNGATFMDPSASWGCGNMVATIGDLVNWTEKRGNGTFHSAAMQAALTNGVATGAGFNYGAALTMVPANVPTFLNGHGPAIGHGGDTPGYHTLAYYFPQQQATIAVIIDSDRGPGFSFPLGATYLADIYNTVVNPYFDVAP